MLERAPEILALMQTRRTQTNEVVRCAVLLPALAALPQSLALLAVWLANDATGYHTLEYLPSFTDFIGDYLLNIDAGLRASVWKALFADLKIEFRYDSTPAPGKKSTDMRYLVGVGWKF